MGIRIKMGIKMKIKVDNKHGNGNEEIGHQGIENWE